MHKPLIVLLPLLLMCADAHAQCAPTDKIYIDPRLVPQQRQLTLQQFQAMMNGRDPEIRHQAIEMLKQRGQPIVMPYGTGKVLVSPDNPCIQQYIP